jgi:ABC-type polysaccharide/polyol phosphate export permease
MSFVKAFGVGWADLLQSFQRHELWLFLSWQDIRQRYRRSVLGPFWMTLSTGILVGTLGFLWSALFNQPIAEYLPFFAIGHVVWTFLSGALTEACVGFTQFESIIKQVRIPFGAMLLRVVVRHLIVLAHNFLIVVVEYLLIDSWNCVVFGVLFFCGWADCGILYALSGYAAYRRECADDSLLRYTSALAAAEFEK